jgi:hypothetical protein
MNNQTWMGMNKMFSDKTVVARRSMQMQFT